VSARSKEAERIFLLQAGLFEGFASSGAEDDWRRSRDSENGCLELA
jgi:hypothetical protein